MPNFNKIEIHYSFTPTNLIKIGAGYGKYGIIDNAFKVRRNNDNVLIYSIPASSVKGRIRSSFKKFKHLLPVDTQSFEKEIFGESGKVGWALFSDLTPSTPDKNVLVGTSTNTAINRFRKTARHTSLRVEEYIQVENEVSFQGYISGYIKNKQTNPQELSSLLFAILATTHFGGDKSTGFGKGKIEISKFSINNVEQDLINLKSFIQGQLMAGGVS